ncbi:MAG: ribosome hibernation-promoting factor, HPF/YfiA family [Gammaproteobacteria bacterium]
MQINVTGHHMEVTEAIRNYVETKFERMERHFDHVTAIHVILAIEKQRQRAEAKVHVAGGHLFADAEHDDMYAAIDALVDKLDRQLLKHKDKITDHQRGDGGRKP